MKIFAGSDHGGLALKKFLISYLREAGHDVEDLGTDSKDSCDYPDYAHAVAEKILNTPGSKGLLTCGSGIGISIAANRHKGIRAALCHNSLEAKLSRQHNDANIIVMGGRFIGEALAQDIMEAFLANDFEGGRHETRVKKIEIAE
jgi:ribose 5-phosphate isomerase B